MSATASEITPDRQNPDLYHPFETHHRRLEELETQVPGEQRALLSAAKSWLSRLASESWTSLLGAADHAARLLSGRLSRPIAGESLLAGLVDRIEQSISRLESAIESGGFTRSYATRVHQTVRNAYVTLVEL